MTHLCYTLEEAAERLGLSETVLVRLSQYFKVPRAAYEAVGYLSFKGDLAFSDQDIAFFQQVKERLLAGETLDTVRSRIREDAAPASTRRQRVTEAPPATSGASDREPSLPPMAPLTEIQDRAPYERAAEKSFQRYKSRHRTGLGKVFENMLREVGVVAEVIKPTAPNQVSQAVRPRVKPLRTERAASPLTAKPQQAPTEQARLPFQTNRTQSANSRLWQSTPKAEENWEEIIREAASSPRMLNAHLKNAAALLRNRALHQADAQAEKPLR